MNCTKQWLYQKNLFCLLIGWVILVLCLFSSQTTYGKESTEKDSAFQVLCSSVMNYLAESPPIWVDAFREVEAAGNHSTEVLARQLEDLMEQYQTDESVYEYVAVLYL
ncbi:MAG: hypothetical protein ACR2PX_00850 [Endozoicomonas sp.]|uniref:hypothetical protein n=1 Tax=Endozoicomonas sp. TaxID=1892382 RepID=UPI003D9AC4B1